jgi:hypothetical protein
MGRRAWPQGGNGLSIILAVARALAGRVAVSPRPSTGRVPLSGKARRGSIMPRASTPPAGRPGQLRRALAPRVRRGGRQRVLARHSHVRARRMLVRACVVDDEMKPCWLAGWSRVELIDQALERIGIRIHPQLPCSLSRRDERSEQHGPRLRLRLVEVEDGRRPARRPACLRRGARRHLRNARGHRSLFR